jgi:hypothetical protein
MTEKDFLDEIIEAGTARNPDFPAMVDEAYRRRLAQRETRTSGTMWMLIRVELLSGADQDFEPSPGRDFLISSQHTFRAFADAINTAFGRWDLGHLHVFRFGDRQIGTQVEDLDFEDDRRTKIAHRDHGEVFAFEFDFGDSWDHRCTVVDITVDPDEEYGERPRRPIPVFGWGTIPDQHGRTTPHG